jgi:hypothetical protein
VKAYYKDQESHLKMKKQKLMEKQVNSTEKNLKIVFEHPDGPCRSKQDVRKLLSAYHSETEKSAMP